MKPTSLTTLAALVLIGIGGFMAGRISSTDSAAATRDGSAASKSSRAAAMNGGGGSAGSARKSTHADRPARATASSASDRLARLESIIRGENPLDRNRALLAFIDQLGPGDFEAAIAQFRSMGMTGSRSGEYALLLSAWAKTDPLAALAYTKANTHSGFATSTILASWASADPEAAIRWAQTNHSGDGANPYLASIIRTLASSDPVRATQLLASMPKSTERGNALDALMPRILAQGPVATRDWIAGLTDDSLRNGAMLISARELAASDPAGTASWLAANPSEATQRRMDDVYAVWSRQDPQAALSAFTSMPSGENRSNALRGLISTTASSDPKMALSMMDRYPNDVTDMVVQQFAWHSFGSDPATAVTQIARMADEGQRVEMYNRMLDSWLKRDAAAATAWVQTNPLPAAVQQHLKKPH